MFTVGDTDLATILTDNDHLYPAHISELRQKFYGGTGPMVDVTEYNGSDLFAKMTNAMADLSSGGMVVVPPGTYTWGNHSTELEIPYSNIWVVGCGWSSKIMLPSDSTTPGNCFHFTNKNNIGLLNLNFEGYYTKEDAAHLFPNYVFGVLSGTVADPTTQFNDGYIVSGCRFYGVYGAPGAYYTHNFFFSNNYHEKGHISFNGFGLQKGTISNNIEIDNGDDAFAILSTSATSENMRSKNITVANNNIIYPTSVVGSCIKFDNDTVAYPARNVTISNNYMECNGSTQAVGAIQTNNTDGVTIGNNIINMQTQRPGISVGTSKKITMVGNIITVNAISESGIDCLGVTNDGEVIIEGNIIKGASTNTSVGIAITPNGTSPKQAIIKGNTIEGFATGNGKSIQLAGVSNAQVIGNNIVDSKVGISLYDTNYGGSDQNCQYNDISHNRVVGINNADTGIIEVHLGVASSVDYNTYIGNKVTNCATDYTFLGVHNTKIGNT